MARPGPGLSGAAEAALLRRHGHTVLSIAAAGAALVVVAAGWRRVLVCWAALELLFYLYQRRRCGSRQGGAGRLRQGARLSYAAADARRAARPGTPRSTPSRWRAQPWAPSAATS